MKAKNAPLVQHAFLSDYKHLKALTQEKGGDKKKGGGIKREQCEGCWEGIHHYTISLDLHRQPDKESANPLLASDYWHATLSAHLLFYKSH